MKKCRFVLAALCSILLLSAESCGSKKKAVRQYSDDGLYPVEAQRDNNKSSRKKVDGHDIRSRIVESARSWIGTPYRYGGESRKGTDCSGMVMHVFADVAGIKLPRNSAKQSEYCKSIRQSELLPGDLVFFAARRGKGVNHVGIYIGNNCFVHASTSRGVIVSDLAQDYYARTFRSAGRVPGLGSQSVPETRKETVVGREPSYEVVDCLPGGRKMKAPEAEHPEPVEYVDSLGVASDSIRTEVRRAMQF